MSNLKRETMQIVELDIPQCALTYGTGACTAVLGTDGVRKCYNTFATCQDKANFDKGVLTLRYAKDQAGLPKGEGILPALISVSTSAAEISLGSPDDRLGTLGKRARVTIKMRDFPYSDALTDKYQAERISGAAQTDEAGYNPLDRSTHFRKMRSRVQYFQDITARLKNGYVGDDIATIPSREFVVGEWAGPVSGTGVTIQALDPIDLTDDTKAVYPPTSTGKIGADIAETGLPTFDLATAGDGAQYDATGWATIGSEIVAYTISGDTVTITERATDGTEAASHAEGDSFQQAARFDGARLYDVADTLFTAAGTPASMIPIADWTTLANRWMALVRCTRIIPQPTGVKTLLNQLCNFGCLFCWDDLASEIKFIPNRALEVGEVPTPITDGANIIEGTLSRVDLPAQLLTQVWFHHGLKDPTASMSDNSNYSRIHIGINVELESEDALNQSRIKRIYQPWLGTSGNDAVAQAIATRFQNRYGVPQQKITCNLDIKDKSDTELAAYISVLTADMVDDTGNVKPTQMQVTSRDEIDPGHIVQITAQTFQFDGRFGYITENTRGIYTAATDAEKEQGTYMVDGTTLVFPDGTGPYVIF